MYKRTAKHKDVVSWTLWPMSFSNPPVLVRTVDFLKKMPIPGTRTGGASAGRGRSCALASLMLELYAVKLKLGEVVGFF